MNSFIERSQPREGDISDENPRRDIEHLLQRLLEEKEIFLPVLSDDRFILPYIDGKKINVDKTTTQTITISDSNYGVSTGKYEVRFEKDYIRRGTKITLLNSPLVQLEMFPEA